MKGLVRQSTKHSATQFFNLDNGSGTTVDEPLSGLVHAEGVWFVFMHFTAKPRKR